MQAGAHLLQVLLHAELHRVARLVLHGWVAGGGHRSGHALGAGPRHKAIPRQARHGILHRLHARHALRQGRGVYLNVESILEITAVQLGTNRYHKGTPR